MALLKTHGEAWARHRLFLDLSPAISNPPCLGAMLAVMGEIMPVNILH